METKFNKEDISSISARFNSGTFFNIRKNRAISIPSEESFAYVLNKARSGNEMAAVQLDEWSRYCKPCNTREKCICYRIKDAAEKIFK